MNNHGIQATAGPGLGSFSGNNGMQLLFSAMERERQQHFQFSNLQGNTQRQDTALPLIDRSEVSTLEKSGQEKSTVNGMTSHLNKNTLLSHNFPQVLQSLDRSAANTTHAGMDLRCLACGIACQSVEELHKHIVYKHLGMENFTNPVNPALLPASKNSYSVPEADKNNQSANKPQKNVLEFPIPTPNFGLINTSYAAAPHLDPALKTAMPAGIYGQVPTSFPSFPSMSIPHQLKSFPVQPFSNPYGVMNSFLGMNYPGLPINGFYPNSTLSGLLGANLNMYPPYLPYPAPAGQPFLPTTARLPFLPAEHTADRNDGTLKPVFPAVPSPKQNNDVTDIPATSKTDSGDKYFTTNDIDTRNSGLRPSISEAYHRRMSTPILGMNSNFRFPYPYRLGKIPDINEKVEPHSIPGKNQTKNSSRDPGNRLNAKSIEQHISKLISNNEKVLLNPALERVKPRRVFRRNSLDPASLSSYATSITGRSSSELQYGEERMNKVERKYSEVNHRRGSLVPEMLRSSEMHHFPPGMTSSEYKKMIQLTRAPHGKTGLLDDAPRMSDLMKQTDENQNFVTNERTQILGKRDSVTHFQTMPPKKLRKTNFFECSDCGVRYRKEENYVIHKQVYCKFKKTDNNANLKNLPIFSQLPINIDAATSRYSVIHKTAQSEPYLPPSTQTTPLQSNSLKIQSFLQSEIGTNPTSFLHNDLCRTKSADAALQTDRRNSSESQPHISAKSPGNSFSPTANNSSTVITTANPLSQNPPCNCIPTSKLPPNKRHMQLLRCSVETTRNQTHSTTTVIPTTSSSVRKVSAPLLQTQPEEANVSDRKLSLQNTWKPNEKNSSFFDECSVPRSNYKLLLHQMSLRNLQDINLIKQSPLITQSENSIWSWEQMCKIGKSPQFINTNKNSLQSDNPIKDISAVSDTVERNTPSLNHSAMGISYANQGGDILPINKPFPPSKGNIDEGEMRSNNDLIVPSVMQGMSSNNLPQCDQKQVEGSDENVGERCNTLNSETDSKDNLNDIGGDKCSDDLLYPHLKPVFYGNAHVSYCCLANPQPTFTKLEPDANQLSMYSKWAVAEPLLLPENITVVDLLASWRKMKNGFSCGISVPSKDTHKLLVTDSKSYNKKSEEDKETTATNKDKIIESSESSPADDKSELNIPKQYECDFFKGNSKYVYTSCSAKYCNGAEDDKSTSSDICDVKLHRKIPEKVPSEEDSISSPVKCSVKISLPSNSTKSSSIESDSGHREVRKLGRVKKRKTRKERSAASPREKRRALYSQSPPSPFRQMAVHQSESCKGQTDDSLKGCALCSIKAGRSDLVPEVSSACKPCREAAISNEKSPNVETLSLSNSTSPSKFSSMYHSPVPEHTNGYLDRTRASGNTQHWMTKSTPNESTSTSAFHYPVLERNDKVSKANPSSPPNTPLTAPEGHPDPVRSPCTPQLAEVVSEVIRTAAIQSKRQGNPHSHPLSHSRPLIPVTSSTYKSANDSSLRTPVNKQNSLALPVSNHASMTSSAPKRNDVAVTSSADAQAPVECDNGDVIALTNGYGKLGRRNLVLSSRESELFLHKANNLSSASASYGKESRPESHCTKASAAEISGEPSEKETACQDEYMSCESDAESEREEYDDFKKADATARPYICVECKVAFRIGGHLAKHLRSKGHTLMMQKKTLNRLKQQQHKVSGAGISLDPDFVASQENETIANLVAAESTAVSSATKPQVLSGTEGLARSQVRALFEGNDEYACVPHCDDVIDGNDDVINPQDPRPFKCLACDVAFRFQGHLDRHFRSNLHLIAVGHYEHDVTTSSHPPYDVTNPSHPTHDDSNVEEKDNEEELIVDGEPSPTPCTDTLSSTVVNSNNTEQCSGPIQNHSSSLLAMTSHKDAGDVTPSALSNYDKNEIDGSNNNYLGNYCIDESQIRQKSNKLNPADGAMGRHNHQVAIPCQMISGFRT